MEDFKGCLFWLLLVAGNFLIWVLFSKDFWGWLIPGVIYSICIYGALVSKDE